MVKPFWVKTPLKKYLVENGIAEEEFAQIVSRFRGSPASQNLVSNWARGVHIPSLTTRAMIASVTHGRVTIESWKKFKHYKVEDHRQPYRRKKAA